MSVYVENVISAKSGYPLVCARIGKQQVFLRLSSFSRCFCSALAPLQRQCTVTRSHALAAFFPYLMRQELSIRLVKFSQRT